MSCKTCLHKGRYNKAKPCNTCTGAIGSTGIDNWESNIKDKPQEAPKRDQEEAKPDMSYLPMDLLEEVARAYEFGGKKGYPRESWRDGFSISRLVAASRRHDTDFWNKGETFDKQAKEKYGMEVYHSAMVIFNQLCILDALINHPELDDRRIKPNDNQKE